MVYPPSHPKYPNMPKGIKAVLTERGLYQSNLCRKCTKKYVLENCCNKQILEYQPDFQAQKSLVQETIEALGHLCLILPKFHCELNFIEFFWGAIKKYLCDNCDYTFDTLKENMPKALESVSVQTIWHCEHQIFWWMEAYHSGLGTAEAQQQVKNLVQQLTGHTDKFQKYMTDTIRIPAFHNCFLQFQSIESLQYNCSLKL